MRRVLRNGDIRDIERASVTTYVAVIGPGEADPEIAAVAESVGRGIAQLPATLVCGGLGGVMAAAARGAKSAGGTTVGLLPGADRSAANQWIDVAIPTGLGEVRNALIVRAVDAVIAVGRGYGTLSEVALALRNGIPVVGVRTWDIDGVADVETGDEAVRFVAERAV